MIKRLRTQFIIITMVLMTVLLMSILILVCYTTWYSMEEDAHHALQAATFEPWSPGGMGDSAPYPNYPCFILGTDRSNNFHAVGHAYYDLTDTDHLQKILAEAQATGKDSGYLWDRNLKFQKIELWKIEEFVFTDISSQMRTMNNLYWSCTLIFAVSMTAFFFIVWGLSKWLVRPIEKALRQQRQFVADASHELKTPLTVIMTNAELLQSKEYEAAANDRFTDGIVTMAEQMRGLVEGMLELAKVDDLQWKARTSQCIAFSDLAENCVMQFEPMYFEADRFLDAKIQPGIHVKGSAQHLQQVVYILLDNGRKYSSPGSRITLTLEQHRSHCTLQVSSQGTTLTQQQCQEIFKRFYRVDEARSMNRSYGLGLPIAESIIQDHRGRIWAQGKEGVNTFFVNLPTCDPGK